MSRRVIFVNLIDRLNNFKENTGLKKYVFNTSWLLLEKILKIIVNLIVGVWIIRYLGPSDFGIFSYVQSFVMLFASVAGLGLDSILVREFINKSDHTEEIVTTSFVLKIFGAIFVLLLLFLLVWLISPESGTGEYIIIVGFGVFFQSFNVIDFYFQSKVKSKYIVYGNIISLLLSSLIKITLLLIKSPLIFFFYVVLFDTITLGFSYLFFGIKKGVFNYSKLKFKLKLAKSLLRDSWPLILNGMIVSFYMRIDQIMIKSMLGNISNGEYSAAVRLSETWYFVPLIIVSSLFPAIVNAKKISTELYNSRLQKLYDVMVWTAVAIALPISFLSKEIVMFFYKSAYSQSANVLKIHVWTGVFVFLGVAYGRYLVNENYTVKSLYKTLLGALINVSMNYYLIPIYGIEGAAIATLISQFTANYLYDIFDKDLHNQLIMKTKSFLPIHLFRR